MNAQRLRTVTLLVVGFALGIATRAILFSNTPSAIGHTESAAPDLPAELEAIKGKLSDQSHAMQDVSYHFSNLWFAGQNRNWELANFYCSETRSHLHQAVRILPVRKDAAGVDIKLVEILEAMESVPLKQLGEAIEAKDDDAFEKAYRFTLETCYACHKAADKPYLRLQIPIRPETPIINFDPNATWPR